ncbi:nck-associated protein 5-like, partial [Talpa occidentalis]|uniref:nck-associated protein 5-like n=1 Tax=Talpa occidentalis TaxID=50954 RepID=UPI0023F70764
MRTLDSGIGTFPLPDSGNRSAGRYLCQPDSPEDPEPISSLQPVLCTVSSIRAHTLQREVPSSADSPGSADHTIVHSASDPVMMARGMRPLQSRLPKLASSGKVTSQSRMEQSQGLRLAHHLNMLIAQWPRSPFQAGRMKTPLLGA